MLGLDFEQLLKQAAEEAREEVFGKKSKAGPKVHKEAEQLENIYVKSLTRIHKIADKFSAGEVTDLTKLLKHVEPALPHADAERKFFNIGDRVRIACSYHDFKYIQKRVPAWKKSMRNLYGERGIVTDQNSKKDATVQVYFPDIFSSCAISTLILEKDESEEVSGIRSQWEVGNTVQTRSHKLVVKQLMRRLPDIPDKFIGKPGKVIAVTTAGVFVSFDGLRSYAIDSALIEKTDNKGMDTDPPTKKHPRGFEPGQKVKVISKLAKLISNQKGKGGWNKEMCKMAGKHGFITDINSDGTVDVSSGFSRGWRMSSESILSLDEFEPEEEVKELDFMPGDKVRVALTDDVRMHLISKNIPLMFLEYLMITGEVNAIDDDLNAWTRFNSTARVCMQMSSLIKATKGEVENFEKIQEKHANLKVGDDVYFDVGPPNYVKAVLAKANISDEVVKALTTTSKIIGWTDAQHAVIQYENGKCYRINKKYLMPPERFDVRDSGTDEFKLKSVEEMETAIANCVQKIHEEDASEVLKKDFAVEVYSFLNGQPPVVEFRIRSTLAKANNISRFLREDYSWRMQELYAETFTVTGLKTYSRDVKIGFLFNEDFYLSTLKSDEAAESDTQEKASGGSDGDSKKVQPDKEGYEIVNNLQELRLFKLQDESLSRAIYFPYVVRGPARETSEVGEKTSPDSNLTIQNCNNVNFTGPSHIKDMRVN